MVKYCHISTFHINYTEKLPIMNALLISIQKDLDVIGLKSLHYSLLKDGHNSYLLHLPHFNPDDKIALEYTGRFILKASPAFIGISLMSTEYHSVSYLTKYLKNRFKSIPVIWGGVHPTICPEMCVDKADYVCIGEGERTIIDIAKAVSGNNDLRNINNLCYSEGGQIRKNRLYPLIKDLDGLPLCDNIYANGFIQGPVGNIINVDKEIIKKYAKFRGTVYSIMSSRGCPFSCTYCCNNLISRLYGGNTVRRRGIDNVISELENAIICNPEIEYVNFQDDCFLACSEEYLSRFCGAYKKRIKKPFIARAIPVYLTRNKMKHLSDAGLAWISLGLQSGSDRICKDIYNRKSSKSDFLKAARIIKDFNMAAFYDVILDNPFETVEDKLETIHTLIETPKPFYPQIFSLSLYLGTELYERAKRECPEKIEDSLAKDYAAYNKGNINNMIRLSIFLNRRFMNKIICLYKQDQTGTGYKLIMFAANLLSSFIFEPLTYFQLLRMSKDMSYLRALAALPNYLREGFALYFKQFKAKTTIKKEQKMLRA